MNEIMVLCEQTDLTFMYARIDEDFDPEITLFRSAGPSTCGIFTTAEQITGENIQLIGTFTESEEE
jgi:L-amino acid N-acyltransferase YncA